MTGRTAVLATLALAWTACGRPSADGTGAAESAGGGTAATRGAPATPGAAGTASEARYPRVEELARGVYSYEQEHVAGGETISTVSFFVVTDEGVLVADGQESPEETGRLVEAIAGITDRPITHVVICSDHGDHTGGNSAFPAGATFYAHPTSLANLEAMAASPNRAADAPAVILPTELIPERRVLELGGREIDILFLGRAHTGGDLVVYLPREKVMFMSETFLHGIFPAMRSAYPSEWAAMIERAQAMDVDMYIPGHGHVTSPEELRADLETYRQAVERVIAEGRRLHDDGVSVEEAADEARFGDLGQWPLYESQAPRAIQRVYMELDGELP